jgi:hypothetical protein
VLRRSHDSTKAAAAFVLFAQTEAWRKLPDVPALERDLAGLSRLAILFLTARFVREYSLADTNNPARWTQATKREVQEAVKIAGGRQFFALPGIGLHLNATGFSQQKSEAVASALYKTKLSRRLRGVSGSLREPKPRKRGYTLAVLCGWSRQRANYWRRQTDQVWPSFRNFCLECVTRGAIRQGNAPDSDADAWNVAGYLEEEAAKMPVAPKAKQAFTI